MATETGVWDLQEVRDKQLASEWTYDAPLNGELWTWGDNEFGELGQNEGGGNNPGTREQIPGTTWSDVMGGEGPGAYKSMGALKSDGTLWMWGRANYGGLGVNDNVNRSSPVQIPGTWKDEVGGNNQAIYGIKLG